MVFSHQKHGGVLFSKGGMNCVLVFRVDVINYGQYCGIVANKVVMKIETIRQYLSFIPDK